MPFFGEWCQYKHCLNNCSYPKGSCNIMSGECECEAVYNPFNKTRRLEGRDWNATYQGIDCSYCKLLLGTLNCFCFVINSFLTFFLLFLFSFFLILNNWYIYSAIFLIMFNSDGVC